MTDCLLFVGCWKVSGEEGKDPFGAEAHVIAKLEDGDEGSFGFAVFAADAGKEFTGRIAAHAGDGSDVFWIDDNAVRRCFHGYRGFGF